MRIPRTTILIGIVIAAVLGVFVYYSFNPEDYPFPQCPFYLLTGLECPGCGSQRALYQLLHLNIVQAFRYNAIFVISIPFLAFLLLADVLKHRFPGLYVASRNTGMSWCVLLVIVLWTVVRNIFGW